jgi:hypothetical protein
MCLGLEIRQCTLSYVDTRGTPMYFFHSLHVSGLVIFLYLLVLLLSVVEAAAVYGLDYRVIEVRSPAEEKVFFSVTSMSRADLRLTQSPL